MFFFNTWLGSIKISLSEYFSALSPGNSEPSGIKTILLQFRIPKAITGVFTGMALSISGLQMQTIFRNPLAGPYVLGISSGASFGVALLIMGLSFFSIPAGTSLVTNWSIALFAWAGAGSILFIILMVSARIKDIMTILILGILFGSAISAVVTILQYFSNAEMLKSYMIWTMGNLGNTTGNQLNILILGTSVGGVMAFFSSKMLNVLLLGENYAKSMGLNIGKSRVIIFISTSLLAGTATAFCGPIGFIGIAVPHVARNIFRTENHQILIPASGIIGSIVLLASDLIAQLPGFDQSLPINSVTALLGIPIIIWVIVKNLKISVVS